MLGDDEDALGALQAVTALERRIQALRSAPAPREPEGDARLTPPRSDVDFTVPPAGLVTQDIVLNLT